MILSVIIILFAISIFIIAKPAWDAGLKFSSALGAISMVVAVALFKLGNEWLSVIPYMISVIAVFYSQYQLKKFGIGPYQNDQM